MQQEKPRPIQLRSFCSRRLNNKRRSSTEDMTDYIKPIARKKPDIILLHVGTNDLTKGINTMKNVRKCVEAILELDNSENIPIGFSSIMHSLIKIFQKLKKYCLS